MSSLMHQDRVEVTVVGTNERGRRVARLIRRLESAPARIAGIFHSNHGRGRVEPEDPGPPGTAWMWRARSSRRAGRRLRGGGDHPPPASGLPAHGRVVETLTDLRPRIWRAIRHPAA
ncbi:MAG: hypothetical protein U1F35_10620 [Steroidobacteraceae bacterium]